MYNIRSNRLISVIMLAVLLQAILTFTVDAEEGNKINLAVDPGTEKYFSAVEDMLIDPDSKNTVVRSAGDGGAYISKGLYSEKGFDSDSANGTAEMHVSITRKEKINTAGSVAFVIKTAAEDGSFTLKVRLIADETADYSAVIQPNTVYAAFLPMDISGNTMFSGLEIKVEGDTDKTFSFTVSDISYSSTRGIADSVEFLTDKYTASGGKLSISDEAVLTLNGSSGSIASAPLNYFIDGDLNGVKIALDNTADAKKLTFVYRIGKSEFSESVDMIPGEGTYRFAMKNAEPGDILSNVKFAFSSGKKGDIIINSITFIHMEKERQPACSAVYIDNTLKLSGKIPQTEGAEYLEIFRTVDGDVSPTSHSCGKLPLTDEYTLTVYGEDALYYGYIPVLVGEGMFEPLGDAVYPVVPNGMGADVTVTEPKGKKGLVCTDGALINELGIDQVYVTVNTDELISDEQTRNTFTIGDKIYFVSQKSLERIDYTVKMANAADAEISLRLTYKNTPSEVYFHLAAFLSQRYSGDKNGTVCSYVIGEGLNVKGDCEKNTAFVSLVRNAILSKNRNAEILLSATCGNGMIAPDDFIYSMSRLCGSELGASITVNGDECARHIADIAHISGVGIDVLIDGESTEEQSVAGFSECFYRYSEMEYVSAVIGMRQNDSDGKVGLYKVDISDEGVSTAPRKEFCDVYKYIDTSVGAELTGKYISLESYRSAVDRYADEKLYGDFVSIEDDLVLNSTVCDSDGYGMWEPGGGATSVSQAVVNDKKAVALTFDLSTYSVGAVTFKPISRPESRQGYCLLMYADYLPAEMKEVSVRIYAENGEERYTGECKIEAGKNCEVYLGVRTFDSLILEVNGEKISPRISVFGVYSCKTRVIQTEESVILTPDTTANEPGENENGTGKTVVMAVILCAAAAAVSSALCYFIINRNKKRS